MPTLAPRAAFVCCSAFAGDGDAGDAVFEVRAIDVAAIAFVARAAGRHELPPSGLHQVDDDLGAALDLLLNCGTDPPPAQLDGPHAGTPGGFVEVLRRRAHRGAIALVSPTLYLDRDGAPLSVSFRVLSARVGAGYAQLRGDQGALEPEHNAGSPTDASRFAVSFDDGGARIEHWQRFGLHNPGERNGRYPKGDGQFGDAPLGWLRLSCYLGADGRSEVQVGSSFLPSAWFYRDWMRVYRHDMCEVTAAQVEQCITPEHEVASGTTWATIDTATGQVHAVL